MIQGLPPQAFRAAPGKLVGPGLRATSVWIRIEVKNGGGIARQMILDPGMPSVRRIDFFQMPVSNATTFDAADVSPDFSTSAGHEIPRSRWPLSHGERPAFPFGIGAHDNLVLFLHVRQELPINVPLAMTSATRFIQASADEQLARGIVLGLLVFLMIGFALLGLFLRDRLYVYFFAYVSGFAGYFYLQGGRTEALGLSPDEVMFLLFCMVCTTLAGLNLAFLTLFEASSPRILKRWLIANVVLFALEWVLYLSEPRLAIIAFYVSSFLNTVVLFVACVYLFGRESGAKRILLALLSFVQISGLTYNIRTSGLVEIEQWLDSELYRQMTQSASFLVTVFLFGFLLAGAVIHYFTIRYAEAGGVKSGNAAPANAANGTATAGLVFEPEEVLRLKQKIEDLFQNEKIHHQEGLQVQDLARVVGIQPYRLSSFLNAHLEQSFWELVTRARVEEAAHMLVEAPKRTVLEIAFAVGFDSKTAFYRAFGKHHGIRPTEFRSRKLQMDDGDRRPDP